MAAVISQKTKTTLDRIVKNGLSIALAQWSDSNSRELSSKELIAVSSNLVAELMKDDQFIECISSIVPAKNKEWLTTEDAARLSGFSRPFIIALLDSPHYPGTVIRTNKGHRRVDRIEFENWIKKSSRQKFPKAVAEVRADPRDDEIELQQNPQSDANHQIVRHRAVNHPALKGGAWREKSF